MMKFAVTLYENISKTRKLFSKASESISFNAKRYNPGINPPRIVYWAKSVNNVYSPFMPFNTSNIILRSSFLMICGNQNYLKHKLDSREQKANSNKNKMLYFYPFFALALFQSKKDEEEEKSLESELIMIIKRGVLAIQRAELNKAEQLLHVALKSAQDTQNHQAITYIYDLLANVAYQREEYAKAENLFKEVLKRVLADGMAPDDNAVVEISLKLASVYASNGDYEKAVQGFHFCIGTQEGKIKKYGEANVDEDTTLLWAMSMDWYARFLLNLQKYELAKKHFIKAYEMSERVQGLNHPQTAVLLNDIGSVCSLQKNYAEAISYLERAIDAAKQSDSPDLGSFYVNLGAVYLQQGMLQEAELNCKTGLFLAKKSKNVEGIEEATACLTEINSVKSENPKK
ncbi:tetratricopeptide repeat protein 19, mitochondrial-like [Palaemon carinicauda]|uniref:tetratricopeptide repeat protein 19, mitochondrial-like n=1 Tax=Palaemon carinicauda TaxID=392227 RepID=UPI0035B6679A